MPERNAMSEPNEVEAHAAKQAEEYGTYVAVAPIDYGGARAFNPGHPVPVSHVEEYGYLDDGLVAKVGDPVEKKPVKQRATPQGADVLINAPEKG